MNMKHEDNLLVCFSNRQMRIIVALQGRSQQHILQKRKQRNNAAK